MQSKQFLAELRRRNVCKVAIAYAIVGWLLIQVVTQTFPFLEIPNWTIRLVIALVILGFPIALLMAWAFEITPEGIKRADEVSTHESSAAIGDCTSHRPATATNPRLGEIGAKIFAPR